MLQSREIVFFLLLGSCLKAVRSDEAEDGGGCDGKKGQECLSRLLSFTFDGYFPFQTEADLEKRCLEVIEAELCLREYSELCLKGVSKMTLNMLIHVANSTVHQQCHRQEKTNTNDLECIQNIFPRFEECAMETKGSMGAQMLPDMNGIPYFCCTSSSFPQAECFSRMLEDKCGLTMTQFHNIFAKDVTYPCPTDAEETTRKCQEVGYFPGLLESPSYTTPYLGHFPNNFFSVFRGDSKRSGEQERDTLDYDSENAMEKITQY